MIVAYLDFLKSRCKYGNMGSIGQNIQKHKNAPTWLAITLSIVGSSFLLSLSLLSIIYIDATGTMTRLEEEMAFGKGQSF